MAFDFTNIKAKGKLNGLSSFSSLPAEDDTVKITPRNLCKCCFSNGNINITNDF